METAAVRGRARWNAERKFYFGICAAIFVVVYVGFARSFFLRPLFPDWPAPPEPVFYLHGAVFTAWCMLLIAQTSLINLGRVALHRRAGAWGAGIAGAMVVTGLQASFVAVQRPGGFIGVPVPPEQFVVVPFFDIVLFAAFVTLGVLWRRDAQAHKRWMVLASVNLIGAGIARWPGVFDAHPFLFWGLSDLFIVALAVWDFRSRGRLHPVTLWGGLALIASQPLRMMLSETQGWLAFVRWAAGVG